MSASGSPAFGGKAQQTSSSSTTSTTNTTLETVNRNVSGNEGVTATEGASINYAPVVINTDSGAVQAGAYVANAGIHAATTLAAQAVDASGKANDVIRQIAADAVTANSDLAYSTTNRALDIVKATTESSAENQKDTLQFAGGLLTQFGNKLADYQLAEQAQLGNVVSALSASFVDNTKTADQRVTDATLQAGQQSADVITSVAKYAAIAVAVGVLAYVLIKKG